MKKCFHNFRNICLKFGSLAHEDNCKVCRQYKCIIDSQEAGKATKDILNKINKMENKSE